MELSNSFTVDSDIDTAWATLLDLHKVAPCFPGATLQSVEENEFTGTVKVKLGPVSMVYGGQAEFLSTDEATHTVVIEGVGKETRGSGTAKAHVTTALVAETPERTRVEVNTDLAITGKAAQFGRGVMQEVAGRIIDQFAANLNAVMSAPAQPEPTQEQPTGPGTDGKTGAPTAAPSAAPTPMPAAADSLDLLGTAGGPMVRRALPVVAVAAVMVVVLIIWSRRRQ